MQISRASTPPSLQPVSAPSVKAPRQAPAAAKPEAPPKKPSIDLTVSTYEEAKKIRLPGTAQVGSYQASQKAMVELVRRTEALKQAQGNVKELDERLVLQLRDLGPGLPEPEQQAYVAAYRAKHAADYRAVDRASEQLAGLVTTQGKHLINASMRDEKQARVTQEALKSLAHSTHASAAIGLSNEIARQSDGNAPLRDNFKDFHFKDEVFEPGLPRMQALLLTKKSPVAAADEVKGAAELFNKYNGVFEGAKGVKGLGGEAPKLLEEAARGDLTHLDRLRAYAQGYESMDGVQRGLAVAAVLTGAVNGAKNAQDGKTLEAVGALASAGSGGAKLLAGALEAGAPVLRQGRLAALGVDGAHAAAVATKGSVFASRLAPGLGLLASGAAVAANVQQLSKGRGDAGTWVSLTGDTLGTVGAALECYPPTAPVGALINTVGTGVSVTGTVVSEAIKDADYRKEKVALLRKSGVPERLVDTLGNGDGYRFAALAERGFNTGQVRELASRFPEVFNPRAAHGLSGDDFNALRTVARDFDLDGLDSRGQPQKPEQAAPDCERFIGLLKAVKQHHPSGVKDFAHGLADGYGVRRGQYEPGGALPRGISARLIEDNAKNGLGWFSSKEAQRAFQDGHAFLLEHRPGPFDRGGHTRQRD